MHSPDSIIGSWRLLALASQGSQGVVFRAERSAHPEAGPFAFKLALQPGDPAGASLRAEGGCCASSGALHLWRRPNRDPLRGGREIHLNAFPRHCGGEVDLWHGSSLDDGHGQACLGVDLTGVPVQYLDGCHDTWAQLAAAPYVSPFTAAMRA